MLFVRFQNKETGRSVYVNPANVLTVERTEKREAIIVMGDKHYVLVEGDADRIVDQLERGLNQS